MKALAPIQQSCGKNCFYIRYYDECHSPNFILPIQKKLAVFLAPKNEKKKSLIWPHTVMSRIISREHVFRSKVNKCENLLSLAIFLSQTHTHTHFFFFIHSLSLWSVFRILQKLKSNIASGFRTSKSNFFKLYRTKQASENLWLACNEIHVAKNNFPSDFIRFCDVSWLRVQWNSDKNSVFSCSCSVYIVIKIQTHNFENCCVLQLSRMKLD